MEELRQQLLDLLEKEFKGNKKGFLASLNRSENFNQLKLKIISSTSFLEKPNFSQRIFHIFTQLTEIPTCFCGSPVNFSYLTKGYNTYCSKKCMYESEVVKKKRDQTNLERYKAINPFQNEIIKEKIKKTNLERYGVENPSLSEEIKKKRENTFISRFGANTPLKNEIIKEKIKQTNLERYGVENPNQVKEIREKGIRTNLEKYGVESPLQNKEILNKVKQTCLERYGVENPAQNKEVQESMKQTNLERYGVESPLQNKEILNKVKQTNLERYGYAVSSKNEMVKEKMRKNNIEKYDVNWIPEMESIKIKIKETNMRIFGVEFPMQNEAIKEKTILSRSKRSFQNLLKNEKVMEKVEPLFSIEDYTNVYKEYKFLCKQWSNVFFDNLEDGKIPRCFVCFPVLKGESKAEKEILCWLGSLKINVISKNRSIIPPFELDIFLSNYNLAIEFNGLYWHSELNNKDRNFHLAKTEGCFNKEVQLLHIFEDEWLDRQEIVKSIIKSKLGFCDRVYARDTKFIEINKEDGQKFLKENHLQGENSRITRFFGLLYKNELIQLIGIGSTRYSNSSAYELIRSCALLNTVVVGGFEKLVKNLPLKGSIISYVDRRYFNGNSYKNWEYVGTTEPNYFYMKNYSNRESRLKYQKHKLPKLFPDVYDINLTEWEIMQLAGYDRIWDCGNIVYSRIL